MITIYVDSDACPVKKRKWCGWRDAITFLCFWCAYGVCAEMRLPNVKNIIVGAEFDAADNWIVEHGGAGDIVVTSDILLAGRCLAQRLQGT